MPCDTEACDVPPGGHGRGRKGPAPGESCMQRAATSETAENRRHSWTPCGGVSKPSTVADVVPAGERAGRQGGRSVRSRRASLACSVLRSDRTYCGKAIPNNGIENKLRLFLIHFILYPHIHTTCLPVNMFSSQRKCKP